jgi:ABC-2 type transport system permease protein
VGVWYFVARFLSGAADHVVSQYGGDYLAYVLVGVLVNQVGLTALLTPATIISTAFWDKRLETYRLAVQGIWANIVGRLAWQVLFSTILQVMAAAALVALGGFHITNAIDWPMAILVWFLAVLAAAGLGLMGASLFFLLEVKNGQDPVTWTYQYLIQIVSGLYVPVAVLPGWLRAIGQVLPQTYTFAAMRLILLTRATGAPVEGDVVGLLIAATIAVGAGAGMLHWALARTERLGGLGVTV